jgi:hypothetical protein
VADKAGRVFAAQVYYITFCVTTTVHFVRTSFEIHLCVILWGDRLAVLVNRLAWSYT